MNFEEFHKPQSVTRAQEEFVDLRLQASSFRSAATSKLPRQTRDVFFLKNLPRLELLRSYFVHRERRSRFFRRPGTWLRSLLNLHPGSANRRIIIVIKFKKASHKVHRLQSSIPEASFSGTWQPPADGIGLKGGQQLLVQRSKMIADHQLCINQINAALRRFIFLHSFQIIVWEAFSLRFLPLLPRYRWESFRGFDQNTKLGGKELAVKHRNNLRSKIDELHKSFHVEIAKKSSKKIMSPLMASSLLPCFW
jgi:hypothetical protein